MKKVSLLAVVAIFTTSIFAQNVVSLRGSMSKQFSSGSTSYTGPGLSFQHAINENVVAGLNLDYQFATGSKLMNIEPRVDYYLKSAFNGIHVGSNIGFNLYTTDAYSMLVGVTTINVASQSFKGLQLGALLGYTHPLTENILVDLSSGIGYGLSLESGGSGSLGVRPALSIGYKF